MADRWDSLSEELRSIEDSGLWRSERLVSGLGSHPEILLDGRPVIDFASNHYLGLGGLPVVREALRQAADEFGAGGIASRLIAGTMPPHCELEQEIAAWKGTESAIVFGSGFLANVGTIQALVGPGDLIVSDELNHASLIDGCRLSRARVVVVPHNDAAAVRAVLHQEGRQARRRLVVVDSVFSMDGDEAPVEDLSRICAEEDAFLYVDEAHAAGVYGPNGEGLCTARGVVADVAMGTLSKAIGCVGAYVAGRRELCDLIRNRARSYIFTTAMPPAMAAAACASVRACRVAHERRRALWENNETLRCGLRELGITLPAGSVAPILPLVVGDANRTMQLSRLLWENGVFAHGIRPPTVPPGTSRIRMTVLATHTGAHLQQALRVLHQLRAHFPS